MEKRTQKQLAIGGIFILILAGISYGFVDYFLITEATCFDGIKNGKEEGSDCGTLACGKTCEPEIKSVEVLSSQVFKVADGDYDFVAKVSNPNAFYGASRIEYVIEPFSQSGFTYILPGQTKYVVLASVRRTGDVVDPRLIIKNVQWVKLDSPDGGVSFTVQSKNFITSQDKSELEAILYNNSNYDFDKVDVSVVLFDGQDNIVGVNRTDIRTFVSKSERGLNVSWPLDFSGIVVRQEVEAHTNLFENSNFIKSYGNQERFQKFY